MGRPSFRHRRSEGRRATGVARPSLYATFGNKESFFHKALDRYDTIYMAIMANALKETKISDVIRVILEGALHTHTHTLEGESRACLGITGALAGSDDAEPIRQELINRRAGSEAALAERFEQAKTEGELSPSADCAVLAKYIMMITQGMAVQAKADVSKDMLRPVVDHLLTTWSRPLSG